MADSTENLTGAVALPKVGVDATGATTFVAIAELIADPSPNEKTRGVIDMTHTDLTNGKTKQAGGWITEGDWTFMFNYREDTYSQLLALEGVDGANWEITWTDPGDTTTDPAITFIGFISGGPTKSTPVGDDRWTLSITITIEEVQTFVPGTTVP